MNGTVKWFNDQKGYGFITGDDEQDVFVHFSEISGADRNVRNTLHDGERVSYDVTDTDKGKKAINVKTI